MKIGASNVKKRSIIFGLDDVLVPGPVNPAVSREKADFVLGFLGLLKKEGLIEFFLVDGRERQVAGAKISEFGLDRFFPESNVFLITKEYLDSKAEADRQRHASNLEKDPLFVDEYFKQYAISCLISSGRISKDSSVLIGHDIWLDAFYTARFSGIDFALVSESLSERNLKVNEKINWLNTIDFSESGLKRIILGKGVENDIKRLETRVFNRLGKELFQGQEFSSVLQKAVSRARQNVDGGSFGQKPGM